MTDDTAARRHLQLPDYWAVVRKRWRFIASLTAVVVGLVALASFTATPIYRASASVFFSLSYGNTPGELSQGAVYTQNQMESYAELATMPVVLGPVIDTLGLDTTPARLAGSVQAVAAPNTVILRIEASDPSPEAAADLANAVAAELGAAVQELSPSQAAQGSAVEAATVGEALPPSAPATPRTTRNALVALVAGLLGAFALAVVRDRFDTRVRRVSDVAALTEAPILAEVSADRALSDSRLVLRDNPLSRSADEFRRLRTNVAFLGVDRRPIAIVLTSAVAGEGKTTTTINLALACAEAGDRVLLIDGDLRRPSVADYLGLEGAAGLTTVLTGRASFDDVIQTTTGDHLHVLTSGEVPPNPTQLLDSAGMAALLAEVSARYDVILCDSPPLLPVVDAAIIARAVAGAVLVTRAEIVHRDHVTRAIRSLEHVDARLLGVVVTGTAGVAAGSYYGSTEAGGRVSESAGGRSGRRRGASRRASGLRTPS